jgi:hypothetical protein
MELRILCLLLSCFFLLAVQALSANLASSPVSKPMNASTPSDSQDVNTNTSSQLSLPLNKSSSEPNAAIQVNDTAVTSNGTNSTTGNASSLSNSNDDYRTIILAISGPLILLLLFLCIDGCYKNSHSSYTFSNRASKNRRKLLQH